MTESAIDQGAVGRRIASLRDKAGLKQSELAKQVTMSPAVLSRVEAGDREPSEEELQALLAAIGTAEAAALADILTRRWNYIPAPDLDHPDQDLLWAAERVAAQLSTHAEADDIRPAFKKRLDEYMAEIRRDADLLLRREHNVAFVGAIGIGKSTAICKGTGLDVATADGKTHPVLETGGGGITLCEVGLRIGPQYGVIVTPRTTEEIRADVSDFADQLLRRAKGVAVPDDGDDVQRAVPREIERAIRNMSDLRQSRTKDPDGKRITLDPARQLAAELGSSRELVVEILSRMELPRRDRREAWSTAASTSGSLEWMKETFEAINNGRHPDFSLPARVDLIVPRMMDTRDLTVNIIDTRGIDQLIARADLEEHLLDSHTVSILCSGFNDAPEQSVQHLLERAREIGNPQVESHAAVLVLARPGEALAVKDEAGIRAESDEDGYELKGEQISTALSPFGLGDLPTEFFNSMMDDPQRLTSFLLERVSSTRDRFRTHLRDVISSAEVLLENVEQQQVLDVQREASRQVEAWIESHVTLPAIAGHVHDTLMGEIRSAHASTLNAAVRREGEWYSLSYSHQLGFGARRVAVAALRDWRTEFGGICNNLLLTHPEASELLGQAVRLMDQAYEDLLKKMQVAGAALYRTELQRAQVLWMELGDEWGRGPGYKERVARRQDIWFGEDDQTKIEHDILNVLSREWQAVRDRISAIFDTD
jgi:transcriptional regulator with XRE-family HTH domain